MDVPQLKGSPNRVAQLSTFLYWNQVLVCVTHAGRIVGLSQVAGLVAGWPHVRIVYSRNVVARAGFMLCGATCLVRGWVRGGAALAVAAHLSKRKEALVRKRSPWK